MVYRVYRTEKWWIFPWQTVSHNQRVLSWSPQSAARFLSSRTPLPGDWAQAPSRSTEPLRHRRLPPGTVESHPGAMAGAAVVGLLECGFRKRWIKIDQHRSRCASKLFQTHIWNCCSTAFVEHALPTTMMCSTSYIIKLRGQFSRIIGKQFASQVMPSLNLHLQVLHSIQ